MVKLYKHINDTLHYWESWEEEDEQLAIVHWGVVGEEGQQKEVRGGLFSSFRKAVDKEMQQKIREGYQIWGEEQMAFLEIEFEVEGFGTEADFEKRVNLMDHLDNLLEWTGLGQVSGSSTGSGAMEVGCEVVDFELAKKVIADDLEGTEFGDYTRIYRL